VAVDTFVTRVTERLDREGLREKVPDELWRLLHILRTAFSDEEGPLGALAEIEAQLPHHTPHVAELREERAELLDSACVDCIELLVAARTPADMLEVERRARAALRRTLRHQERVNTYLFEAAGGLDTGGEGAG
jgi:hypothetical protein